MARPWSAGCYGVARQRDRSRQNSTGGPALTPISHPYAREGQAVVCPLLRGRSPTRSVAPKQHRGLGRASLRHFGLARGCRRIWRGVSEKQGDCYQSPLLKLSEESDSKERISVSNWIVQRLYN